MRGLKIFDFRRNENNVRKQMGWSQEDSEDEDSE